MKVHFREQYGTKGEEILYVTPAGKQIGHSIQPQHSRSGHSLQMALNYSRVYFYYKTNTNVVLQNKKKTLVYLYSFPCLCYVTKPKDEFSFY